MANSEVEVIVVGGGNAAFCAALAAQEKGSSVTARGRAAGGFGGNTRFTTASVRVVYNGVDDIKSTCARSHGAGNRYD